MTKIYVIHENNEWTEHLVVRLDELGLEYELWHLDEGHIDLSQPPPKGVFIIVSVLHPIHAITDLHPNLPTLF